VRRLSTARVDGFARVTENATTLRSYAGLLSATCMPLWWVGGRRDLRIGGVRLPLSALTCVLPATVGEIVARRHGVPRPSAAVSDLRGRYRWWVVGVAASAMTVNLSTPSRGDVDGDTSRAVVLPLALASLGEELGWSGLVAPQCGSSPLSVG